MANYGPADGFLIVQGKNLSGDVTGYQDTVEQALQEVRGLGDSWDKFLPVGIGRVLLESEGNLYDDRLVGQIAALQGKALTPAEAAQIVDLGSEGLTLGKNVVMLNGTFVGTWTRTAERNGITMANGAHTITGKRYEGKIVGANILRSGNGNSQGAPYDQNDNIALPAISILNSNADDSVETSVAHGLTTGDWVVIAGHAGSTPSINSGTSSQQITVVDTTNFTINGVDITVGGTGGTVKKVSSAGLIADIHVLTLILGPASDVIVRVRHSEDNITYADLITFAARTAAGQAEQLETTTDPRRYLAISWTGTGGAVTSVTPFVSCART